MTKQYSFHPFADLFPLFEPEDLKALAEDLKTNGQLEKIRLFEDKILDGRNRYSACVLAGIEPEFVEFEGTPKQALDAVLSWNLHRRHLSESQRGMVGARLEPMFAELAKERKKKAGKIYGQNHPKEEVVQNSAQPLCTNKKSRDEASQAVNVSHATVDCAKSVLKYGTDALIAAVEKDMIAVSTAAQLTKLSAEEQDRIASKGKKAASVAANALKQEKRQEKQRDRAEKIKAAAAMMNGSMVNTIPMIKIVEGETVQLGPHTITCGDSSTWRPTIRAKMAFADPPYNAGVAEWDNDFAWNHDWIQDSADYVFVTPGTANFQYFFKATKMNYQWIYTHWLCNGIAKPNDQGMSNLIHAILFSNLSSVRLEKQIDFDLFKATVDSSKTHETSHPGRKPESLLVWLIEAVTKPGDVIIDPFLGSGTTLFAAEATGRVCHGYELSVDYCQDIINRWQFQSKA